jgi:hypothetical protein
VHILTALTRALGVSCFDSLATAAALRFTCDLVLMPEAEVIFGLTGLKVGIIISVLTASRRVASRLRTQMLRSRAMGWVGGTVLCVAHHRGCDDAAECGGAHGALDGGAEVGRCSFRLLRSCKRALLRVCTNSGKWHHTVIFVDSTLHHRLLAPSTAANREAGAHHGETDGRVRQGVPDTP